MKKTNLAEQMKQEEVVQEPPKGVILELRPIQVSSVIVKIKGLTPLIVHAWSRKVINGMLEMQQMTKEEKKKARENRQAKNPQEEFEGAKHLINGVDSFPTTGVKSAMITAGSMLGISKALIKQAVFVVGDYFEIKHKKCVMREDTVRVGPWHKRTADLRYRPEYRDWSATLKIQYRADMIKPEQVVALLEHAGFSVGLAEWRPEKNGQFGRFEVVKNGR